MSHCREDLRKHPGLQLQLVLSLVKGEERSLGMEKKEARYGQEKIGVWGIICQFC